MNRALSQLQSILYYVFIGFLLFLCLAFVIGCFYLFNLMIVKARGLTLEKEAYDYVIDCFKNNSNIGSHGFRFIQFPVLSSKLDIQVWNPLQDTELKMIFPNVISAERVVEYCRWIPVEYNCPATDEDDREPCYNYHIDWSTQDYHKHCDSEHPNVFYNPYPPKTFHSSNISVHNGKYNIGRDLIERHRIKHRERAQLSKVHPDAATNFTLENNYYLHKYYPNNDSLPIPNNKQQICSLGDVRLSYYLIHPKLNSTVSIIAKQSEGSGDGGNLEVYRHENGAFIGAIHDSETPGGYSTIEEMIREEIIAKDMPKIVYVSAGSCFTIFSIAISKIVHSKMGATNARVVLAPSLIGLVSVVVWAMKGIPGLNAFCVSCIVTYCIWKCGEYLDNKLPQADATQS